VFNIRGVSQNELRRPAGAPGRVYQDDSYSSSINLASFPVFDLARIETLRGPQGTLFGPQRDGRRDPVHFQEPTDQFEGYTDLTYGSFNQTVIDGALSGPLSENVQGRIAFIYDKDDGCMESIIVPACRIVAATTTTRFAAPPRLAAGRRDGREFHRRYLKADHGDAGRPLLARARPARTRRTRASSRRPTLPARSGARVLAMPALASRTRRSSRAAEATRTRRGDRALVR
jgi:hypothetical protein